MVNMVHKHIVVTMVYNTYILEWFVVYKYSKILLWLLLLRKKLWIMVRK